MFYKAGHLEKILTVKLERKYSFKWSSKISLSSPLAVWLSMTVMPLSWGWVAEEGSCSCFSLWVMFDSFVTPWGIVHQAPLSMGFPRQEYWSGLLFPSPGDLPDPGTEPASPALPGRFFTTEPPNTPNTGMVQRFSSFCCIGDCSVAWLIFRAQK